MASANGHYDVLVIEDSSTVLNMITRIIESEGYKIGSFGLADDALNYLHQHKAPHLIFLDYVLPEMSSVEFLQELQHDQKLAKIPVVMISTYDKPKSIPHIVDFLEKPIDLDTLMGYVSKYCH